MATLVTVKFTVAKEGLLTAEPCPAIGYVPTEAEGTVTLTALKLPFPSAAVLVSGVPEQGAALQFQKIDTVSPGTYPDPETLVVVPAFPLTGDTVSNGLTVKIAPA
jgi:hypothetical protein